MWSWLPALVAALLAVAKGLFGLDKPQQVTTDEKDPHLPAPADADVLADMGISTPGATVSPGAGFTGGEFPTIPVVIGDDGHLVGLYPRPDSGNAVRDRASGSTPAGDGKPDHPG